MGLLLNQYGKPISASTYSSTRYKLTQNWTRPRFLNNDPQNNGFKSLNPSEKRLYHSLARDLFRSSNTIRSAITRKNGWACASGWVPFFTGQDKAYGEQVISYLNNVINQCNTAGANYTFNRTLTAIANEIDVGGDCMVIFVQGRDGLLRMSLYPSSVVGQRGFENVVPKGSRYTGNNIFDGVVYDSNNSPIAFSILQEDKENDYYVSAKSAQLLFEPEEGSMLRGISIIVASLIQFLNQQDIEDYQSRIIKLQSKIGVITGTQDGTGRDYIDGYTVGSTETDACGNSTTRQQPVITDFGDYVFINGQNEAITSFEPKQPGTNVAEWIKGIEEKCLYGLGWHLALISPNSIGSYAARIMESQVQQMVSSRQQTLKRIAKTYCLAVIAKGIESGDLPQSNDWRKIDFHLPETFQIDSYYGAQTSLQQWQIGNASLQQITAKAGVDWTELRNQREIEADDALQRAARLSSKHGITIERALDLISKQTVNAAPAQQQIQEGQ